MKKIICLAFIAISLLFSCNRNDYEQGYSAITEESNLYKYDGGVIVGKMSSKESGGLVYSVNISYNGKNEVVAVTKDEYELFGLCDTVRVAKPKVEEEFESIEPVVSDYGYKIVTIGGENYLVIKLRDNVSINDTIFK